jgi:Outer membrane protein beta-barrel family
MVNTGLFKFWNLSLTGDFYDYRINGTLLDNSFARESFNWSTRISNQFQIGASTDLEFDTRYNSPSVSAQGRWEGFFRSDLAIKHDLWNKKVSLTLQIRDIFNTAKYEFTSEGPGYYNHSFFTRQAPVVMLNLRFNFNNYQNNQEQQNQQNQQEQGGYNSNEGM